MRALLALCAALALGCSQQDGAPTADGGGGSPCGAGLRRSGPACEPIFDKCKPDEVPILGGGCNRVGPPDKCLAGWSSAAKGWCEPILPAAACTGHTLARIGEATCQTIGECGNGTFGKIQVKQGTLYVDGSYQGSDADGTKARPFKTIQAAVSAAPSGGHVAVAAGTYIESLVLHQPLVLEGRCAEMVTLKPSSTLLDAVVDARAALTLRGVSVAATPEVTGVLVEGADATLEAVLVGGVSNYGVVGLNGSRITIQGSVISGGTLGGLLLEGTTAKVTRSSVRANGSPTSKHGYGVLARWQGKPAQLELQDSLVRKNANAGVVVLGSNAVVERTAVVETFEATDGQRGGYGVRLDREKGTAGKLELRDSLVAANQAIGLHVRGSEATVDRSVFRGTQLSAAGDDGYGVRVGASPQTGERGKLVLRDSLVNGNRTMGISLRGAEAVLERVVVQGTLPRTDGKGGLGVSAELPEELGAKAPATELTLRDCVVQDNHWAGILLEQATATLERVAVRDTRRDKGGESLGRGINAYGVNGTMKLTLKDSVVSGNADVGISLTDTAATMARVLVRDTEGYGVQIKSESASAAVDATDLAVSTSRGVGIIVGSVAGSISRSVVRNTRQLAGQLGDGVVVARASPSSAGSSVALTDMLVEESARAGMLFVASDGSVSGSVLRRGVFAIDLELGANPKIGDDNRFEDNKENKVTYGQSLTASPAPEIPSL